MAEEDEIRELMGRLAGARRQGFHLTPAMVRLVMATMRFYLGTRALLARPNGDKHDDTPRNRPEPYTGPPATIASMRRSGVVAVTITCDGPDCWNSRRVLFDDLGLHEATPVPDIPRRRGFRCRKCGCRRVRVSPDWTDHQAQGTGR